MESSRQLWALNPVKPEELLSMSQDRLGLVRLLFDKQSGLYEMRAFITDYTKQTYHYAPSYSCSANKMPSRIFTSEEHRITFDEFRTYQTTLKTYCGELEEQRLLRVDLDLRTLYKAKLSKLKPEEAKNRIITYINSFSVVSIPELVYSHCVLTMNRHIFDNLPGMVNDDHKQDLDPMVYRRQVEEIKAYLREQIAKF